MDSFRQDDEAWGPLIRRTSRHQQQPQRHLAACRERRIHRADERGSLAHNPASLGGSQNYVFFEPLPLVILAQLAVGQELLENTSGNTQYITNRLYIQPGVMIKFGKGSGLDVLNPGASLNVGSRSYITGYDATPGNEYGPTTSGFVAESANDPQVLFTSLYDNTATTPLVPADQRDG